MAAITLLNWILALSPVLIVLLLMTVFKWGGSKAGVLTWLTTQITAFAFFGAGLEILQYSYIKAFFLSIDVLLIIWGAMFLYQVTKKAGTIQRIGTFLVDLAENKAFLGIFLGWLFPSFLQGMGGFGVPVAVSAPLLVSAGFTPVMAVILPSIGHGWGVSFGSMGSSIRTMGAVTGLSVDFFGPSSAILLGIAAIFSGIFVIYLAGGKKNLIKSLPLAIISAIILAYGQYLLVGTDFWIIAVTLPALVSLIFAFLYMFLISEKSKTFLQKMNRNKKEEILHAAAPYIILVILIVSINFIIPLRNFLKPLGFSVQFPELTTGFGYITPAGNSRAINLLLHPGTIIILSGYLSYVLLQKQGFIQGKVLKEIVSTTFKGSINTTIAIFSLVGTAALMNHAGMTSILAEGISNIVPQSLYPLISPFIGALGAFITGSNNNSNVLFGALQMQTAQLMGLPITLILAAQTAGGAFGSIMAPAKVILGCSTVGLDNKEGEVIGKLVLYSGALVLIIGISAWIFSRVGGV